MRVSVIVPTFNRAGVLGEAIRGALDQSYPVAEVIVVDDASTDGTAALVAAMAGRDARVRRIEVPHRGAAAARNAGIRVATGDIVAFLDSDDLWEPWHIEACVAVLQARDDVGLTWSNIVLVDPDGTVIPGSTIETQLPAIRQVDWSTTFPDRLSLDAVWPAGPAPVRGRVAHVGDAYSQMVMGNIILTSSVVMRRSVIDAVGWFNDQWQVGEDFDFLLRACRDTRVAFIDVPSVRYRVGRQDKLARPENALAMATAYLAVLDRTLSTDRSRLRLPPHREAIAVAHAHRWIGELELTRGDHGTARRELWRSLRARPVQAAVPVMLVLTVVPSGVLQVLFRWRRAILGRAAPAG